MPNNFYEDTTYSRDVTYLAHDEDAATALAERHDDKIEAVLDFAVARGAIGMNDRPEWRSRLHRGFEMTSEVLGSLKGNPALADKAFHEDRRIRDLGNSFDGYMGITSEVREFDETAGISESELLYKRLAEATNEHLFTR